MARVILHFLEKKTFTMTELNCKISNFDYSDLDKGNKVPELSESSLKTGYFIITAAQMSALAQHTLGFLLGTQ